MANHKIEIRRRNVGKILHAAEKVFAEKGYGATSMGDIAEQAELPRSNLHYYFSTKDDLFRAVLQDLLGINQEAYEELVRDSIVATVPLTGEGQERLKPQQAVELGLLAAWDPEYKQRLGLED